VVTAVAHAPPRDVTTTRGKTVQKPAGPLEMYHNILTKASSLEYKGYWQDLKSAILLHVSKLIFFLTGLVQEA
jgi:hypothetical protein